MMPNANEFVVEQRCEMCKTVAPCADCDMVVAGTIIARFPLCIGCQAEMKETHKDILKSIANNGKGIETMDKEKFNFGKALERLKEGKKVCRSGWNGKGMFLMLQPGSTVKGTSMHNEPARTFYGDSDVNILPHIDMKAADGSYFVGWTPNQIDMLAEDWQIHDAIVLLVKTEVAGTSSV